MNNLEIDIHRQLLIPYLRNSILVLGLLICGFGVIVSILFLVTIGSYWLREFTSTVMYSIQDGYIKINQGVWFKSEKTIPLDRVTDFILVEGPLMRYHGIKAIRIQTAGSQQIEGQLLGVVDPEKIRESLIEMRNEAVQVNTKHNS